MKNCSNCKHKKSYFSNLVVPSDTSGYKKIENHNSSHSGYFYIKCDKGNIDKISSFYEDTKNNKDVFSCYQDTDISNCLNEMIDIISKMNDFLDKDK